MGKKTLGSNVKKKSPKKGKRASKGNTDCLMLSFLEGGGRSKEQGRKKGEEAEQVERSFRL